MEPRIQYARTADGVSIASQGGQGLAGELPICLDLLYDEAATREAA